MVSDVNNFNTSERNGPISGPKYATRTQEPRSFLYCGIAFDAFDFDSDLHLFMGATFMGTGRFRP